MKLAEIPIKFRDEIDIDKLMYLARLCRGLLARETLLVSQKRYNIREQLSRYHEPDKFKKHMLAACEPFYKPDFRLPNERCNKKPAEDPPLHPLDIIISDELVDEIKQTNAFLVIQYNYTPFQSERVYKNTITKLGGKFHGHNNRIYKRALSILGRPEILNLFVTRNALVTGDAESLPQWVNAIKKMPHFILIAGTIEGYLVNKDFLFSLAQNSDLNMSRSKLSAILSAPGQHLNRLLQESSGDEPKE